MIKVIRLNKVLDGHTSEEIFVRLYGEQGVSQQKQRYRKLTEWFVSQFPGRQAMQLYSAPGRTEVGGNHTDHNAGRVLAAAVDLDALAAVAKREDGFIHLFSEGYPVSVINTSELSMVEEEKYTSHALIRGVCARMKELGYNVGGFEACVTSNVLKGSGLSSTASFEILIGTILNDLYNRRNIAPIILAQIGQYAENHYFGKPCGLMDQTTSAVGGFVTIDFQDFSNPVVKKVDFDFAACGFSLAVVATGGSHADLNEDYAALEAEMKAVAKAFGGKVLREFTKEKVLENITTLRTKVSDRAILRALHFYDDDQRVVDQVKALESNDFPRFLNLVVESGYSSWMLCQNCYSTRHADEQGISVGLAVSQNLLKGRGAWRVHGGGFAGTVQAFVPNDLLPLYVDRMRAIFGEKSCYTLMIRSTGATRVDIR